MIGDNFTSKNLNRPEAKGKRVLVAMSGGVDSSVAAAILKDQGYDVVGVTMQVWDYAQSECDIQEGHGTCCSSIDVDDARAVADHLDIPFYVINCEEEFKTHVIDDFVDSYLRGRTPIPCVHCNTFLKFDYLIKKMKELNCDYIATGHYAQVQTSVTGEPAIVTSSDDCKDQTYFLFGIQKEIIPYLLFPVGDWQKPQLREYAEKQGLPVFDKKDSTGICFVGKSGYSEFVESQTTKDQLIPGEIKLFSTGEVMAQHDGIHKFTYGQRKGVGVSYKEPLYVRSVERDTGTVWLCEEKDLYKTETEIKNVNLLDQLIDDEILSLKIRFAHKGAKAQLKKTSDGYKVQFFEPQRSITPGQAAVFYRDQQLLGGGWIV